MTAALLPPYTACPALPFVPTIELSRLAVRTLTQSSVGTLDVNGLTGVITFTPSATFDDFDVFAYEYDLYDVQGRRETHLVVIDAALP